MVIFHSYVSLPEGIPFVWWICFDLWSLERPIVLAYIPQLHWLIYPFPVPLAAWWGVICPHKSRSQNLSSHPKSPTYHPPIIHPSIKLHRTIQQNTPPQRHCFETTRGFEGFDSNPSTRLSRDVHLGVVH